MNDEIHDGDPKPDERYKLGAGEGHILVTPGVLDRETYEEAKAAGDGSELRPRNLDDLVTLQPSVTTRPDLGELRVTLGDVTLEADDILPGAAAPQRTWYNQHTGGDTRKTVANFRIGRVMENTESLEHADRLGTPVRLRVIELAAAQCEHHATSGRLADDSVASALSQLRTRLRDARTQVRHRVLAEIGKEVSDDLTAGQVLVDSKNDKTNRPTVAEVGRLLDRIRDRDRILRALAAEAATAVNPE